MDTTTIMGWVGNDYDTITIIEWVGEGAETEKNGRTNIIKITRTNNKQKPRYVNEKSKEKKKEM